MISGCCRQRTNLIHPGNLTPGYPKKKSWWLIIIPFFRPAISWGEIGIGVGHPLDSHGNIFEEISDDGAGPRLQKEDHNESLVKDLRSLIFKVIFF